MLHEVQPRSFNPVEGEPLYSDFPGFRSINVKLSLDLIVTAPNVYLFNGAHVAQKTTLRCTMFLPVTLFQWKFTSLKFGPKRYLATVTPRVKIKLHDAESLNLNVGSCQKTS